MRRSHRDKHDLVAAAERADTVDDTRGADVEALHRRVDHRLDGALGHARVVLEFHAALIAARAAPLRSRTVPMKVATAPTRASPARSAATSAAEVEVGGLDANPRRCLGHHVQPPVTGGKNATSAPSAQHRRLVAHQPGSARSARRGRAPAPRRGRPPRAISGSRSAPTVAPASACTDSAPAERLAQRGEVTHRDPASSPSARRSDRASSASGRKRTARRVRSPGRRDCRPDRRPTRQTSARPSSGSGTGRVRRSALRRTRRNSRRRSGRGQSKSARSGSAAAAPSPAGPAARAAAAHRHQEGDEARDRVAGQADEQRLARPPSLGAAAPTAPNASGLPGLIATCHSSSRPSAGTAGRRWSSSPTETPPAVTIRSCAAAALAQRCARGVEPVGHDAQIGDVAAGRLQQAAQREAVRVVDRAWACSGCARHHQFVAGREQRHARPAQHRQRRRADAAASPSACGVSRVRAQHRRPGTHVLAAAANPLAGLRHGVDAHAHRPRRRSHCSCITMVSAPGGTWAPVKMRATVPGAQRRADDAGGDALRLTGSTVPAPVRRRRAARSRPSKCCRPVARRAPSSTSSASTRAECLEGGDRLGLGDRAGATRPRAGAPARRPGSAAGAQRSSGALRRHAGTRRRSGMVLDVALDGAARPPASTVKRRGRSSMPLERRRTRRFVAQASRSSARTWPAARSPARASARRARRARGATFRPSAVWGSIIVPKRSQVSRIVARRSAVVAACPRRSRSPAMRANSSGASVKPPSRASAAPNRPAVRAAVAARAGRRRSARSCWPC